MTILVLLFIIAALTVGAKAGRNRNSYTALHTAVAHGDITQVNTLVDPSKGGSSADIDKTTTNGETALIMAIERKFSEIAQILLKNGADPNQGRSPYGEHTPLTLAIQNGQKDVVEALLAKNADPNLRIHKGGKAKGGRTPLGTAIIKKAEDIVNILLDNPNQKADPNLHISRLKKTPIVTATAEAVCLRPENPEATKRIIKKLRESGAEINPKEEQTALGLAINRRSVEMVKFLLTIGADANHPIDHNGTTPLNAAIEGGTTKEIIKELVNKGAKVNGLDHKGETPLGLIKRMLQTKGSDDSHTKQYFEEIEAFLKEKGANVIKP
ncbi:ankyrin repeats (3 copies) domain-containing protein [Ditylenchus destructor]|uniref:Ankyrin repeats (3 copies) domain-containing protein n=1 Tax=Ditylenchus destructor TaxID=166010 RepID=A0AAD4MYH1_9BILA|nr:ankyrin repeats (3 copies) domain-containing protein [Ditylenchus destructor]